MRHALHAAQGQISHQTLNNDENWKRIDGNGSDKIHFAPVIVFSYSDVTSKLPQKYKEYATQKAYFGILLLTLMIKSGQKKILMALPRLR